MIYMSLFQFRDTFQSTIQDVEATVKEIVNPSRPAYGPPPGFYPPPPRPTPDFENEISFGNGEVDEREREEVTVTQPFKRDPPRV